MDSDSINSILSGREIQRLKIESERKLQEREYESYTLMRNIVTQFFLRNSLEILGVEWSYLFLKECRGYKAPERILRPTNLTITDDSHKRIKATTTAIIWDSMPLINDIDKRTSIGKELLNAIYGRRNNVDS